VKKSGTDQPVVLPLPKSRKISQVGQLFYEFHVAKMLKTAAFNMNVLGGYTLNVLVSVMKNIISGLEGSRVPPI